MAKKEKKKIKPEDFGLEAPHTWVFKNKDGKVTKVVEDVFIQPKCNATPEEIKDWEDRVAAYKKAKENECFKIKN